MYYDGRTKEDSKDRSGVPKECSETGRRDREVGLLSARPRGRTAQGGDKRICENYAHYRQRL